jgi:hypothetical protein
MQDHLEIKANTFNEQKIIFLHSFVRLLLQLAVVFVNLLFNGIFSVFLLLATVLLL